MEIKALYKRAEIWRASGEYPARPVVYLTDPDTGVDYRLDARAEVVAELQKQARPLATVIVHAVVANAYKENPRLRIEAAGLVEGAK